MFDRLAVPLDDCRLCLGHLVGCRSMTEAIHIVIAMLQELSIDDHFDVWFSCWFDGMILDLVPLDCFFFRRCGRTVCDVVVVWLLYWYIAACMAASHSCPLYMERRNQLLLPPHGGLFSLFGRLVLCYSLIGVVVALC